MVAINWRFGKSAQMDKAVTAAEAALRGRGYGISEPDFSANSGNTCTRIITKDGKPVGNLNTTYASSADMGISLESTNAAALPILKAIVDPIARTHAGQEDSRSRA